MAFMTNAIRQLRTEQFQAASIRLVEIAAEVYKMAALLDESAICCEGCGSTHYNNWPQRQLRSRVSGAADRLQEISEVFRRRSTDDEFLGLQSPGLAQRALQAIDIEGRDANPDGDVTIPSHVWDLVQQALGRGAKVADGQHS